MTNTIQTGLNIPFKEPKQLFNIKEYEGTRVRISSVKQVEFESHYVNGVFEASKTEKVKGIEIETEPITEITNEDGSIKPLVVRQRFNLQKDKEGNIVISKDPKAKLWKFMRKMGVDNLNDLVGKYVKLTTEPSKNPDDDRVFLRIIV